MTNYIGAAPLTMVRTVPGGYVNVLEGDPVPANIEQGDLKRLLDEGFLVEGPEVDDVESDVDDEDEDLEPSEEFDFSKGIDAILEWVGSDEERALEALEAEQAKGDDARSTLVAKLEAILEED